MKFVNISIKFFLFIESFLLSFKSFAKPEEIKRIKAEISALNFKTPPKRIVTLSVTGMEILDVLDVKPVGIIITAAGNIPDYLSPEFQKITVVGKISHPSLERIKELKPELILIDRVYEEQRDVIAKLTKIAPVLNFRPDTYSETLSYLNIFAELLQKQNEAKKYQDKFESKLKEVKLENQKKFKSVLALYVPNNKIWAWTGKSFIANLIAEIGVDYAYKGEGNKDYPDLIELSAENILKINPENIIVFDDPGKNILNFLEKNPIWKNLSAVKNKNVVVVERERGSRSKGPLATLYITENMADFIK